MIFHAELVLDNPVLTSHIGAIACLWTEVEMSVDTMIITILGTDARVGLFAYHSEDDDVTKMVMLRAVAASHLLESELEHLTSLLRDLRVRREERNKVVRGSWGIAHDFPDEFAWQDPRESVRQFADITALVHGALANNPANDDHARHRVMLYSLADFQDIESSLETLRGQFSIFLPMSRNELERSKSRAAVSSLFMVGGWGFQLRGKRADGRWYEGDQGQYHRGGMAKRILKAVAKSVFVFNNRMYADIFGAAI